MMVPEYHVYKFLSPQRAMAVVGDKLKLYTDHHVKPELEVHWKKTLGSKVGLRYGTPNGRTTCVLQFPNENLSKEEHSVDPDKHYHVFSKFFIPGIKCPQARVLNMNKPEFPCVVKCAYGAASEGTFMAYTREDYDQILQLFRNTEPDAPIMVTEMIQNLVANYCCQFYLTGSGQSQWLGVTEQMMGADGLWMGAKTCYDKQAYLEALLKPTLLPVADKLHEWEYFGVVGVDILVDKAGAQYVIDINPRLNGSTPMLLASRMMGSRGWNHGIFLGGCSFKGKLGELIAAAEGVKGGVMMVFGVYEHGGVILCNVGVWGVSSLSCEKLFKIVFK